MICRASDQNDIVNWECISKASNVRCLCHCGGGGCLCIVQADRCLLNFLAFFSCDIIIFSTIFSLSLVGSKRLEVTVIHCIANGLNTVKIAFAGRLIGVVLY